MHNLPLFPIKIDELQVLNLLQLTLRRWFNIQMLKNHCCPTIVRPKRLVVVGWLVGWVMGGVWWVGWGWWVVVGGGVKAEIGRKC